jgi:4-amino-4-deoxy-L-arabinose transferase-like glycosyltransferase
MRRGRSPWPALLLLITSIRFVVAARMPLSADEAYYWVWSRALAPGYLDHPPMVALWIRAGTALAGQSPLGIRLLGPLAAAGGTWLLAKAAEDIAPARRAGLVAACLLNGTLLLNVGAVVMTPDTPLLLFWTAGLFCLARLLRSGNANWWLAFGASAGLALDSKYTALLLGMSVALWLVALPAARRWRGAWQVYAGALLAFALFAPVLLWNSAHHWASFVKQGGRSGDWAPAQAVRYLGELIAGQIGLATPVILAACCVGLWRLCRRGRWQNPGLALILCVTLLPALVFIEHAFGDRVQANWPGIVYPGAVLAAACAGVGFWRMAAFSGLAIAAPVYLQAAFAPLSLPRKLDFSLIRLAGWNDLAGTVYVAAAAHHAGFVAADDYGLASELAFRLHMPVLGVEPRWAMFALAPAPPETGNGILLRSARRSGVPDAALWPGATYLGEATRQRHGQVAETYRLYLVAPPTPAAGAVQLPARPAAHG